MRCTEVRRLNRTPRRLGVPPVRIVPYGTGGAKVVLGPAGAAGSTLGHTHRRGVITIAGGDRPLGQGERGLDQRWASWAAQAGDDGVRMAPGRGGLAGS